MAITINGGVGAVAQVFRYRFIATGGETSKTGADTNGLTLSYIVGNETVYLNGALLVRGSDYTATDGATIGALTALTVSDVLEIITYSAFNVATNMNVSLFTAKGDILIASAPSTAGVRSVGADGLLLMADSTAGVGVSWSNIDLQSIEVQILMGVLN